MKLPNWLHRILIKSKQPERLIKGECSACGGKFQFPEHGTGQTVPCPHCSQTITLAKPKALPIFSAMQSPRAAALIGIVAIICVGWALRFKFDKLNNCPIRINRFTGRTEILHPSGWEIVTKSGAKAFELKNIPDDQIQKLHGTAEVSRSELRCKIYNGSVWRIHEIVVHLEVFESNSKLPPLQRDYLIAKEYFTNPLTTGIFDVYVGFDLQSSQQIGWYIKGAKGQIQ